MDQTTSTEYPVEPKHPDSTRPRQLSSGDRGMRVALDEAVVMKKEVLDKMRQSLLHPKPVQGPKSYKVNIRIPPAIFNFVKPMHRFRSTVYLTSPQASLHGNVVDPSRQSSREDLLRRAWMALID